MSNEFESQVEEKIFEDKIKNFFKKFKIYIILFLFLIIIIPIFFQIKIYILKKNNELAVVSYSLALEELNNKNVVDAKKLFENLLLSDNNTVALLSLNQLYKINKESKNEFSKILDKKIFINSMSEYNTGFLKLQKALLIFDSAPESEMLNLLNIKNKKNYFYKLNLQIIYDFYVSKNEKKKAEEIKILINEK